MITVGSLFSGIGGLDLGLERAGMRVIWQSEIDPYACRVLAKHWPTVPNLGDVTTIDWGTVERPDLICGGYPCQPFSLAGVRRGEGDPRHLWPHFHRAIRCLRPRYALLENVPGHLSMGFGAVLGDLAEIGYDVEWCSVPAAAVGAPHLRWRLFAVAYPNGEGQPGVAVDAVPGPRVMVPDAERAELRQQPVAVAGGRGTTVARHDGPTRYVADTEGVAIGPGLREGDTARLGRGRPSDGGGASGTLADTDSAGPQERRLRRAAHNGDHWAVEPDVGRVADGVPNRVDRLRCLGNAVVPQVAELIGHMILKAVP